MIGNPEVVKVPWREYNNFSKRFFHGPNDLFQKVNKAVYDFTLDFDMKHTYVRSILFVDGQRLIFVIENPEALRFSGEIATLTNYCNCSLLWELP